MSQATLALHAPEEAPEPAAARQVPPNGRSGRVIAVALLAVLVVVWFAPAIVARSGLRHGFVHAVLPAYAGEAEIGHASLGWLSPVVLRNVELSDVDGHDLLRVEEFRTSQHLLALLAGRSKGFGVLTLTRPELSVRLKTGGSNVEEMLAPLLDGEGGGSGFEVRVVDAAVAWTRLDGERAAGSLKDVSATISRNAGDSLPDHIELGGTLTDGEHPGTFTVRSVRRDGRDAEPHVSVVAKDLPLGALQSWLDRFEVAARVTGTATADVLVTAPADGSSWNVDGRVAGRRMRFERVGVSDAHPLLLEEASLAGRASADGSLLTLDDLELSSDVGTATVNGSFDLGTLLSENGLLPQVEALLANEFSLNCSADLKSIAAALPESLRLRQPVQSGTLAIDVKSSGEEGRRRGTIRLRASDIVAGSAENPIVWRQPFAFDLVAVQTESGLTVESAHAESEFLTLRGAGSATAAELTFDTDLDRLRENLSRFVELPADALAGRAEGRITIKRGAADKVFDVDATGAVRDLMLSLAGRRWTERELSFHASAECEGTQSGVTEIRSGTISLQSVEKDEVRAVLMEPVRLATGANWKLSVTAKGDSTRWFNRARAWRLLPEATSWTIAGQIDAKAEIAFAGSSLRVS
nr:hypothetical protein [Planctomycetota bacterium]